MNTLHDDSKARIFPHYEPRLEDHLEHEHVSIRVGLQKMLYLVCADSDEQNSDDEIEFRNHLIWISRIMKAHMTSEERVVFKRTYESLNPHQKKEIDRLCDVNGSIDLILDDLETHAWSARESIMAKVMLLIQLFDTHIQYESEGLGDRLESMPPHSHRFLIRQLVHSENEFLDWINTVEKPCLPV